jgi:hypothetical protein
MLRFPVIRTNWFKHLDELGEPGCSVDATSRTLLDNDGQIQYNIYVRTRQRDHTSPPSSNECIVCLAKYLSNGCEYGAETASARVS